MPHKDRDIRNAYRRDWYAKNAKSERARLRVSNKRRHAELLSWCASLKLRCACGEDYPACLQFHHEDPEEKEYNVADMVKHGFSRQRILDEIAKCVVVCANCHIKLHH